MRRSAILIGICLMGAVATAQDAVIRPDAPITCDRCDAWNAPRKPFPVFGNTYYVGPAGLSSILIASDKGHILLDGALPQSAALIDASIRSLGFRTRDIRLIVTSHEHFDHVGGVAALQRASGATVAFSAIGAQALTQGGPTQDDPQGGPGSVGFPRVRNVRAVSDGETLRVGELAITAHLTPGHTPGGTTWTWRACEGARCMNIVYAVSLNAVSLPAFRFTERPGRVEAFRQTIAKVQALPCDILLTVHPEFIDLDRKMRIRADVARPNPFIDPKACQTYGTNAIRALDRRVDSEKPPAAARPK